ncbi:9080_t:CDS:2, partial [Funneliformis caledonium]
GNGIDESFRKGHLRQSGTFLDLIPLTKQWRYITFLRTLFELSFSSALEREADRYHFHSFLSFFFSVSLSLSKIIRLSKLSQDLEELAIPYSSDIL